MKSSIPKDLGFNRTRQNKLAGYHWYIFPLYLSLSLSLSLSNFHKDAFQKFRTFDVHFLSLISIEELECVAKSTSPLCLHNF